VEPEAAAATDGGVIARLQRRNRLVGSILAAVAALGVVYVLVWFKAPSSAAGLTLKVIILLVFVLAARQLRVAGAWSRAQRTMDAGQGFPGVVGDGRALQTVRPGQPVKRRHPAAVVPIRTEAGPLVGGTGLLIHGRSDGVSLSDGDEVIAWQIEPRRAAEVLKTPSPKGHYVIRREGDGQIFAGDTSVTSVF